MIIYNTATSNPKQIIKRDGTLVPFDFFKIRQAIAKANANVPSETLTDRELDQLTSEVVSSIDGYKIPEVEEIQDIVEVVLMENGVPLTAKAYIIYRSERTKIRDQKNGLMDTFKELTYSDA